MIRVNDCDGRWGSPERIRNTGHSIMFSDPRQAVGGGTTRRSGQAQTILSTGCQRTAAETSPADLSMLADHVTDDEEPARREETKGRLRVEGWLYLALALDLVATRRSLTVTARPIRAALVEVRVSDVGEVDALAGKPVIESRGTPGFGAHADDGVTLIDQ